MHAPLQVLAMSFLAMSLFAAPRDGMPAEPAAAVDAAFRSGAACIGRAVDSKGTFGDPYLAYEYPDERLPHPEGSRRLTYRVIDAYAILTMLRRAGPLPSELEGISAQAEEALRALAPAWRGRGFTNTLRNPRTDGIALDTYCIVGWLSADADMAREVVDAIEGDRWLPAGWYDDLQTFRAAADESWCLRLALSAGRSDPSVARVRDRLTADLVKARQKNPTGPDAFYRAWHFGMLAADGKLPDAQRAIIDIFSAWADAHVRKGRTAREDIAEWVNLASSETLAHAGARGARIAKLATQAMLRHQDPDGCWTIPGARPANDGYAFLTLRALLALQVHRAASRPTGEHP